MFNGETFGIWRGLGLATTRIGYKQSTVEMDEDVLDDLLALFSDVLLIVSHVGLATMRIGYKQITDELDENALGKF